MTLKHSFATLLLSAGVLAMPLQAWASSTTKPSDPPAAEKPLRVVLFDDKGAPDKSAGFVETCLNKGDAKSYSIKKITGDDVRAGALDSADIAVFPGGSGSGQARSLGVDGRAKVREFVKNGGGYMGICGGSYLATSYYPWSLNIVNAAVVDRKHWARGRATLPLTFTDLGKSTLGVPSDSLMCLYHQGPLLAPDDKTDLPPYQPLATFAGEVTENGAPKGVMIGTNAMVRTVYGKGHVLLISPHPEQTEGLDYIIRSAVKWIGEPEATANPLTGDETTAKSEKEAAATEKTSTK